MFVCCECCVLSGRGLCDELITRPEESYRLCCVVVCDLENLKNEEAMTRVGPQCHKKKIYSNHLLGKPNSLLKEFGFMPFQVATSFFKFLRTFSHPHNLSYIPIWFSNSTPSFPSALLSTNFVTVLYIYQLTSLSIRGSNPGLNIAVNFVTFPYMTYYFQEPTVNLCTCRARGDEMLSSYWPPAEEVFIRVPWGHNRNRKWRSDV